MILSIDIGIKNFGVYLVDDDHNPMFLKNINLSPYSIDTLILKLTEICYTFNFINDSKTLVLIEKQLTKNVKATIVSAHVEAFFKIKYPKIQVIFCNSKNKGINKTTQYKTRKLLSVQKAEKYLEDTNYEYAIVLKSSKKRDDMADAVCQLITYLNI